MTGGTAIDELTTIGGIATVSVLHSFIPTHWLPFSIVGRAQKWTITQTLLVSKFDLNASLTELLTGSMLFDSDPNLGVVSALSEFV